MGASWRRLGLAVLATALLLQLAALGELELGPAQAPDPAPVAQVAESVVRGPDQGEEPDDPAQVARVPDSVVRGPDQGEEPNRGEEPHRGKVAGARLGEGMLVAPRDGAHVGFFREDHHHMFGDPWIAGRAAVDYMVTRGLEPHHTVLDYGSGAFRVSVWLLHYLRPGNLFALEPWADYRAFARYEASLHGVPLPPIFENNAQLREAGVKVDRVVCYAVLLHLKPYVHSVVQVLSDSLKDGGVIHATLKLKDRLTRNELRSHCLEEVHKARYQIMWQGNAEDWVDWRRTPDCEPTYLGGWEDEVPAFPQNQIVMPLGAADEPVLLDAPTAVAPAALAPANESVGIFVASKRSHPEMYGAHASNYGIKLGHEHRPPGFGTMAVPREGSHVAFFKETHHKLLGSPWILGRAAVDYLRSRGLQREHTVVDFGAKSFRVSIWLMHLLLPGRLHAVEPQPQFHEYAKYEASLHGLLHVMPPLYSSCAELQAAEVRADRVVTHDVLAGVRDPSDLRLALHLLSSLLVEGGVIHCSPPLPDRLSAAVDLGALCLRQTHAQAYPVPWHAVDEHWVEWTRLPAALCELEALPPIAKEPALPRIDESRFFPELGPYDMFYNSRDEPIEPREYPR